MGLMDLPETDPCGSACPSATRWPVSTPGSAVSSAALRNGNEPDGDRSPGLRDGRRPDQHVRLRRRRRTLRPTNCPPDWENHMVLAGYRLFRASDGPIAIAPSTPKTWERVRRGLELEECSRMPGFQTSRIAGSTGPKSTSRINQKTRTRRRVDGSRSSKPEGCPAVPINTLREAFVDPSCEDQEMVLGPASPPGKVNCRGFAVKLSETPARLRKPSPQLAESTEEILREIGLSDAEIRSSRTRGVDMHEEVEDEGVLDG